MISIGKLSLPAVFAEFVGMALFIFVSTGSATGFGLASPGTAILSTAVAFGGSITALAYALGPRSGAQFNPSVSLGLVLTGNLGVVQGATNILAQTAGAILGSSFVLAMYPDSAIGSNSLALAAHDNLGVPFLAEAIGTFALVFVVLECCCNKTRAPIDTAPIAIGLTVFIAHLVLIPYTSCSINPSRSLGPAIVSGTWPKEFWIFMFAPFTGAAAAAGTHILFEQFARPAIAHAPAHV
jgi:MIP family channel proteins